MPSFPTLARKAKKESWSPQFRGQWEPPLKKAHSQHSPRGLGHHTQIRADRWIHEVQHADCNDSAKSLWFTGQLCHFASDGPSTIPMLVSKQSLAGKIAPTLEILPTSLLFKGLYKNKVRATIVHERTTPSGPWRSWSVAFFSTGSLSSLKGKEKVPQEENRKGKIKRQIEEGERHVKSKPRSHGCSELLIFFRDLFHSWIIKCIRKKKT